MNLLFIPLIAFVVVGCAVCVGAWMGNLAITRSCEGERATYGTPCIYCRSVRAAQRAGRQPTPEYIRIARRHGMQIDKNGNPLEGVSNV